MHFRRWAGPSFGVLLTVAGCGELLQVDQDRPQAAPDGSAPAPGDASNAAAEGSVSVPPDGGDAGNTPDAAPLMDAPVDATDASIPVPTSKRVFVTQNMFPARQAGIDRWDQICADAAVALGGSWVAWISLPTSNAIDRMGEGPWYLVGDGGRVAASRAQLALGIERAIERDERGETIPRLPDGADYVWTGTRADGTAGDTCDAWSGSSGAKAARGNAGASTVLWTHATEEPCDDVRIVHRVYCFEK